MVWKVYRLSVRRVKTWSRRNSFSERSAHLSRLHWFGLLVVVVRYVYLNVSFELLDAWRGVGPNRVERRFFGNQERIVGETRSYL